MLLTPTPLCLDLSFTLSNGTSGSTAVLVAVQFPSNFPASFSFSSKLTGIEDDKIVETAASEGPFGLFGSGRFLVKNLQFLTKPHALHLKTQLLYNSPSFN